MTRPAPGRPAPYPGRAQLGSADASAAISSRASRKVSTASWSRWDSWRRSARASFASTRLRTSAETPWARVTSTPSRSASQAAVSAVGRVFPRSIWLTYSFEALAGQRALGQASADAQRPDAVADTLTGRTGDRPGWCGGRIALQLSLKTPIRPAAVPQSGEPVVSSSEATVKWSIQWIT